MNKILYFIKLPPPTMGTTLMNQYVNNSKLLRKNFIIRTIGISYSKNLSNLGKENFKKILIVFKTLFKLIKELMFNKPDLIYFQISHIGNAFLRDVLYVLIIKIINIKIVYHLHGKGIKKASINNFKKLLYKFVFKNSEIICLSNLLSYDIEGVFKGQVHFVPNGIPSMNYFKERKNKSLKVKILFLSNLIISKGIFDYIVALEVLSDRNINFEAFIVGSEGDLSCAELNEIITNKGLQNKVKYLGPKYGDEKYDILNEMDIFVFPTFYNNETWGLVNLEAMQFALPIISTREGAIPEVIDDAITGFIVNKNSPDEIAEKLKILINNPQLRKKMGQAGRKKYLEKYTLEKFEENMNNVFEDAMRYPKQMG